MIRNATILLLFLISISFHADAQSKELKRLAKWMSGSYSSEQQHLKDTANYFDIRLQIIPIWKHRTDGYWFYVEQAVFAYYDQPYRQRVYQLTERPNGTFESKVFTMKDPLRFTHKPRLVELLNPDSLYEREGCSVILAKKDKKSFAGETEEKKCPSDRKGAAYATSEVTIFKSELHSWDRGYDSKNKQVWGAEKRGYIFIKK